MQLKTYMKIVLIVLVTIVVVSCSTSSKDYSPVTGWKYNDEKGTGFTVNKNIKNKVPPGMIAIEEIGRASCRERV